MTKHICEVAHQLHGTDAARLLLDPSARVRSYTSSSDLLEELGCTDDDGSVTEHGMEVREELRRVGAAEQTRLGMVGDQR